MKQKLGRKLLSFLLTLAMVIGLVPGMSLTAYAATDTYTALKNNATVVQFNGYNWYIIEDNSTSATEGTVTLLVADNGFGLSKFSDSQSNAYSSSKIKVALDAMTAEGGAFAGVADAIADTDLADVSVTGAKLYLLSTSEAQNLNPTILGYNYPEADNGIWWLRSLGTNGRAAIVFNGSANSSGGYVDTVYGVRPALKLNLSKVTFDSTSKTFSLKPPHTHSFTYAASGATITATCGAAGCDLTDSKATLTIVKPTLETYLQTGAGISAAATLTGLEAFKTATGLTVTVDSIKYFKATKSGSTYTKDGTALAAAPTYAGDYIAEITLTGVKTGAETTGDVAASVGYTIAKAEITITTAPAAGEITYGQTLEDSTLTGGVVSEKDDSRVSVEGTFAWKDSTVVPTVSDSQKTEYDVVFTPKNTNYATAECKVKLTVNKADSAVTKAPTAKTLTYTGSPQALVSAGTAEGGEMQYALGTETEATEQYTTSIPSKTDAGTYYVWYKVKGDDNHVDSAVCAAPVIVTIAPANKDALNTAITEAETYYNTIKDNADYAAIATTLKSAIDAAKEVADNDNATEEQVSAAANSATNAKKTAEDAVKAADEKKAADVTAAKAVTDAINALPESAGVNDKAKVEAARKAYEALTEDQKKLVPEDALAKLTAAEQQVREAEEAAKAIDIAKCKITVKNQTYTGKALKPAVTVKRGKVTLKKGTDYTVTYKNNVKIGLATATVKGKGKYVGTRKVTFKINPKGTAFTKLTGGNRRIALKWKNPKKITGYRIQYSRKKDFSIRTTVTIEKAKTLTATFKRLAANKTYYVRIRTYTTVNRKNYYSAWSKAVTVKTKSANAGNGLDGQDAEAAVADEETLPLDEVTLPLDEVTLPLDEGLDGALPPEEVIVLPEEILEDDILLNLAE